MQISASIPAQTLSLFQVRRSRFRRHKSNLNPISKSRPESAKPITSTELNKKHLANLDKMLGTQIQEPALLFHDPLPPKPKVSGGPTASKGKTLLEGLNLTMFWPEMRAVEEMSPRHLNRLRRLLSMEQEYSPRNHLGSRWTEYHGSKDWVGLLDPLDENLRREVVRYGEFIQAAYDDFHSNPAMSTEEAPLPRHVALPDRSYKVTKSLYATSSVGLPKWVDEVAPDLGWLTQRSSCIGYVAVCEDKNEIHRMGRRDIIIALRGTSTCLEWAENLRAQLVDVLENSYASESNTSNGGEQIHQAKVECGFLSLYKTQGDHVPSLRESLKEEIKRLMELYKTESLSITITGHSLGAALAVLAGDDLISMAGKMPPIAVFSFGGPKVGNKGFANQISSKNLKVLRMVNNQDVITKVPNMPLAYSHVGAELRVDTRMSPYLKPNADVACCHDLEAYLHLVDGFRASNCPFRANAKRSLVKLLNDQKSNVKKLYTNKAHALRLNLKAQGFSTSGRLPSPSQ